MANDAASHETVGAGEEGRPLLIEAAQNTAELKGTCAPKETPVLAKDTILLEKKTTLVEKIALIEALQRPRTWTKDGNDDADTGRPQNPTQTEEAPARKSRTFFIWVALGLLFLVTTLALRDTPQLCFRGYCLNFQPSPITAFRGGPRHDMTVMVRDHDESAGAAEWVWSLGANGRLSRKEMGSEAGWDTYQATRFLGAPVVQRRGPMVRVFAIEAGTGHLMVGAFFRDDGRPDAPDAGDEAKRRAEAWNRCWEARPGAWGWHSLGGRFAYQPTIAEAATGHVEAYAVTDEGSLLRRALAPGPSGGWGAWSVLGSGGFVGEVDVLVSYTDRGHVIDQGEVRVAAVKDGQYKFASSHVSPRPWNGAWRPLGVPDGCRGAKELGWPVLVELNPGDVEFVVACGGSIWHKTYGWDGEWSGRWQALGKGLEGVQLETHGLTRSDWGNGRPVGLYARASVSGCVYRTRYVGPEQIRAGRQRQRRFQWSHWRRIWCPEEPLAVGNLSLAVDNLGGRAVALGEANGTFLYSGVIDFQSSDPLRWQRHDRL